MSSTSATPPGWFPDPGRRHELRYWDGVAWTEHVSNGGVASQAPIEAAPAGVASINQWQEASVAQVQQQVAASTGAAPIAAGTGDLFNEPTLVVNQKAKIYELNNEYTVFDAAGQKIGAVVQVNQSGARKALRLVSNIDQFMKVQMELRDAVGRPLLLLTRPGKVLKSTVVITRPDGSEAGRLVQQNAIGKIRFSMESGGHTYGSINAENWRAWNFSIRDHAEQEVARITKTFEGFARAMFTTADNYVVQIHQKLEEPMRTMVIAAAVTVDTALKQGES